MAMTVLRRLVTLLPLTLLVLTVVFQAWSEEGCSFRITNDEHIAVAAELASTTGYPDVIELENSLVKVSLVPNRGRLLFGYFYKPSGHQQLYSDTGPLPLRVGKDYMIEFGGYYLSHPWNERANQPYDLDYEVLNGSPEECGVRVFPFDVWLQDNTTPLEAVVKLKRGDPTVYVRIKIQNVGSEDVTFDFFDRAIITAGGDPTQNTEVILPTAVREVSIGESKGGWLGEEGSVVPWPQPWSRWGAFSDKASFSVDLASIEERSLSIYNPESKETFTKEWSPEAPYNRLEVLSWGPSFEDEMGAYPGFGIMGIAEDVLIPAGGAVEFEVRFYVSTPEVGFGLIDCQSWLLARWGCEEPA